PVFVIDAQGDWVDHYRQWHRRGLLFLVRTDGDRDARLGDKDGEELLLGHIAVRLSQQAGAFRRVRFAVPRQEGRAIRGRAGGGARPAGLSGSDGGRQAGAAEDQRQGAAFAAGGHGVARRGGAGAGAVVSVEQRPGGGRGGDGGVVVLLAVEGRE